jgi:hypothetical protein
LRANDWEAGPQRVPQPKVARCAIYTRKGSEEGLAGGSGGLYWCAEHVRQLEGESPFDNLMEVKS